MKHLIVGSLFVLAALLGAAIDRKFSAHPERGRSKTVGCDDTRLGEIATKLKTDPASSEWLRRAAAGDAESALNLAVMFGKIDFEKMMCFERMAAENGGKVSQANYGKYLTESQDPVTRARGKYWLDRADRPEAGR